MSERGRLKGIYICHQGIAICALGSRGNVAAPQGDCLCCAEADVPIRLPLYSVPRAAGVQRRRPEEEGAEGRPRAEGDCREIGCQSMRPVTGRSGEARAAEAS